MKSVKPCAAGCVIVMEVFTVSRTASSSAFLFEQDAKKRNTE
jgi:hypothetical protein